MNCRRAVRSAVNGVCLLLLAACASAQPQPTPTVVPTDTAIPPSATPAPTDTPEPTSTPNLAATAAVKATQAMAEKISALAPDLQAVGYDTTRGRLAWTSEEPVEVRITAYNTHDWVPLGDEKEFSDFILKADVTWESTSGLAVCGFWLRGESYDPDASHYLFVTLRLSGLPLWDVEEWAKNAWVTTTSSGGKSVASSYIDQTQGATNTYILVADGNLLTAYVNGNRLGKADINKRSEGVLGYYALQESGDTSCTYDNVWVWDLTR